MLHLLSENLLLFWLLMLLQWAFVYSILEYVFARRAFKISARIGWLFLGNVIMLILASKIADQSAYLHEWGLNEPYSDIVLEDLDPHNFSFGTLFWNPFRLFLLLVSTIIKFPFYYIAFQRHLDRPNWQIWLALPWVAILIEYIRSTAAIYVDIISTFSDTSDAPYRTTASVISETLALGVILAFVVWRIVTSYRKAFHKISNF